MITVRHEENRGIGAARNTGVDRASGDCLLFLDSDDTLTAGALRDRAGRLAVSDDPDLLLFDHVRTYWWHVVRPSAAREPPTGAGAEVCRPAERTEFLQMFAVVWNRAFRSDFFVDHGFRPEEAARRVAGAVLARTGDGAASRSGVERTG
ncbi:hypothetical protein San01_57240 [Streptomyces angustmyceticus]|uniref:Glycosyltransferase 2-like domain-containing protein n=1 Tax=Streptomyces angustmyceticus TaxID=285578 RepID=A0A5J4LNV8_9ACTN|nr:hypothetical protein San01_57240 [Streptomyces angustmyceticus]